MCLHTPECNLLGIHFATMHQTHSKHGFGGCSNATSSVELKMWVHQITLLEVGGCVKEVEDHFHDVEKAEVPQKFVEEERVTLMAGVVQ